MPTLRETQAAFRDVMLGGDAAPALGTIATDGLTISARLAIYRHHVSTSLTDVLRAAFPVVCRLVDERFFAYAADAFIAKLPPRGPCLHEYGDALPEFLATFPPCRELVYLPDVARLEWAMSRAQYADDAVPLDPCALARIPDTAWERIRFVFQPSLTLLASPWPIDAIWRSNQPDADPHTTVDLGARGARLEIRRRDDGVIFRARAAGDFVLRRELQAGRPLSAAAAAALAEDAAFDLAAALSALIHDHTLVKLTHVQEDNACTRCR